MLKVGGSRNPQSLHDAQGVINLGKDKRKVEIRLVLAMDDNRIRLSDEHPWRGSHPLGINEQQSYLRCTSVMCQAVDLKVPDSWIM